MLLHLVPGLLCPKFSQFSALFRCERPRCTAVAAHWRQSLLWLLLSCPAFVVLCCGSVMSLCPGQFVTLCLCPVLRHVVASCPRAFSCYSTPSSQVVRCTWVLELHACSPLLESWDHDSACCSVVFFLTCLWPLQVPRRVVPVPHHVVASCAFVRMCS